jgi:hypothetical protein
MDSRFEGSRIILREVFTPGSNPTITMGCHPEDDEGGRRISFPDRTGFFGRFTLSE